MTFQTLNPATGAPLRTYPRQDDHIVSANIERALVAQTGWRQTPHAVRRGPLANAGSLLRERADDYARLITEEMGKPLAQSRAEILKCASVCDYYAENAERQLAPRPVAIDAGSAYVDFQPLGVILGVMPWNFPFWQVFRFAAPTLAAGNAILLKHAANVTGCAVEIAKLFTDAQFPDGLFQSLLIDHRQAEAALRDPRVRGVSLTGSVAAGRHIGRIAGEELKKVVLELGGSDAYLVLEDADVPQAAEVCAAARLVNAGQSCVAAKRFIVVEAVREAFESALIEVLKAKKLGDPMDDGTDVGPMARADLRDELHRQVQKSIELGARCMLGGQVPEGPGAYYPVTLLTGVKPGMPAWEEELFGPVAATLIAEDETHALAIANQSRFGLGGAVFSRDLERARRVAAEMDCGMVAINRQLESDPRLPFGGVKESGVGREVGEFGIMEFVNIKTVTLSAAGGTTRTARSE